MLGPRDARSPTSSGRTRRRRTAGQRLPRTGDPGERPLPGRRHAGGGDRCRPSTADPAAPDACRTTSLGGGADGRTRRRVNLAEHAHQGDAYRCSSTARTTGSCSDQRRRAAVPQRAPRGRAGRLVRSRRPSPAQGYFIHMLGIGDRMIFFNRNNIESAVYDPATDEWQLLEGDLAVGDAVWTGDGIVDWPERSRRHPAPLLPALATPVRTPGCTSSRQPNEPPLAASSVRRHDPCQHHGVSVRSPHGRDRASRRALHGG